MTEKRESSRRTIKAEVKLKRRGAINYEVRAYDLSETGCRLEFVEKPWLGETVWVKFEGLETLRAKVRWSGDFVIGLEFDHPIDPRVLEWLISGLPEDP